MTHASVFSGIGGPEVAAAMLGWENLFHCEINPFGRAVLDYWFPNSKSYEDITTTDFSEWQGRCNVLTGGFPCQPFSKAGKRRGADDDRYLWPIMFRCIDQVKPDWVVCENVVGVLSMVEQSEATAMATEKNVFDQGDTFHRFRLVETFTIERICDDLEGHGMPSKRWLFQLVPLEPATNETVSLSLAGETVDFVKDLIKTPCAWDYMNLKSWGTSRDRGTLGQMAASGILLKILDSEQSGHEKGGDQLSPLFTEEMMGFPFLWTTLPFLRQSGEPNPSKPTATQ